MDMVVAGISLKPTHHSNELILAVSSVLICVSTNEIRAQYLNGPMRGQQYLRPPVLCDYPHAVMTEGEVGDPGEAGHSVLLRDVGEPDQSGVLEVRDSDVAVALLCQWVILHFACLELCILGTSSNNVRLNQSQHSISTISTNESAPL